jgi:hypothetical protein
VAIKGKLTVKLLFRSRRFLQVSLAEYGESCETWKRTLLILVNRACVFGCLALFVSDTTIHTRLLTDLTVHRRKAVPFDRRSWTRGERGGEIYQAPRLPTFLLDFRHCSSAFDHSSSDTHQPDCLVSLVLQTHLSAPHHRRQLGLLAAPSHVFPYRCLSRHSSNVWRGDGLWALVCWTSRRIDLVDVSLTNESLRSDAYALQSQKSPLAQALPSSKRSNIGHWSYQACNQSMEASSPALRARRGPLHLLSLELILTFSRMFSIASLYPAGSWGRQLAWIFLGGLAVVTFAVGLSQPDMEEADPVLKLADSSETDEERPLLGPQESE